MSSKVDVNSIFVGFLDHPALANLEVGWCMPNEKRRIRHAAIVEAFAERLRSTRASRQMTQRDLANKAQVTLSYVSKLLESGEFHYLLIGSLQQLLIL